MDNATRYCKDCRHFVNHNCREERNMRLDLVKGGMATRNSADFIRADPSLCGASGAWFVQLQNAERFARKAGL